MRYADGLVWPVPKKKLDVYRRMSSWFGKIWKEQTALEYVEDVAEDARPGRLTSFPQSAMLKRPEAAVIG